VKRKRTSRRTVVLVTAAVVVVAVIAGVVIDSGHRSPRAGSPPPVSATANSSTATTDKIPLVSMPNLVGRTQAQIGEILAPGGLNVTKITLVSSGSAAGTVLSQHPSPGSRVKQRASVVISVSNGEAGSGSEPAAPSIPSSPSQCASGNVSFVDLTRLAGPICVKIGTRLTVTFVSSASTELTGYGRWTNELPTVSDDSVLAVGPYGFSGKTATAVFTAVGAGSATATAYFDVSCAPALTTPCTIPPLGAEQTVTVTVVNPP
jgi:PASTA domain